jgi:hypothetical protein
MYHDIEEIRSGLERKWMRRSRRRNKIVISSE